MTLNQAIKVARRYPNKTFHWVKKTEAKGVLHSHRTRKARRQ